MLQNLKCTSCASLTVCVCCGSAAPLISPPGAYGMYLKSPVLSREEWEDKLFFTGSGCVDQRDGGALIKPSSCRELTSLKAQTVFTRKIFTDIVH